jgi:hypothetical protein
MPDLPQTASKTANEPNATNIGPPNGELWLVEIWRENRNIFKTLMSHPLLFSIPIGSLLLFDFVIRHSSLDEPEKKILLQIDFYGVALVLAIFTLALSLKL